MALGAAAIDKAISVRITREIKLKTQAKHFI
jgi:hypothetical protein